MATLILLRHAKTEPHRPDDHSRVLTERGRADAKAVREWFLAEGLVPEVAVVSTAARARETWELADPGASTLLLDGRVYEASTDDLRAVIAEATASSLAVVGHNPSIERLAAELDPTDETNRGMRTSGVAVFETSDWELADARLTHWR